jgi:hypothetical protein
VIGLFWDQTVVKVAIESDVVHVDMFGTHIVVVNSAKAANNLFDKRSSLYSDRCVTISSHIPHTHVDPTSPTLTSLTE